MAPAENPSIPTRFGSTPHLVAFPQIIRCAVFASARGGLNPYRHRLGEFVLAEGSFFHPVFEDGWQIAGGSYAFALGTSAESLGPLTNVKIAARKWGP
jgi:hypothetical protein